ncbi:acyltransferase family protein [uncultured Solobacterium sp.]|uniref:acyltransferase n=1 Tax=uncultured Solobacterium sp. TaxID=747375 RepID=UPI0028EA2413|nr:acyltransferase family protein [uncultured Solobacterium sp.]
MKRKVYCDYLRLVATFAVVFIHVAASNWSNVDVNGIQWQVFNIYDSLVRWGVPIFVMISGALFLNRDVPIKNIYSKYVLRMVIAFVSWSLFYAILTTDTFQHGLIYSLKSHIGTLVTGHYHMWFVLMIIGLYMCIPFMKKIVSDETVMKYFLKLSFIFAFLIPWVLKIVNDFVGSNNSMIQKMVTTIDSNLMNMGMSMVLGYTFYFILGYYLDRIEIKKDVRVMIYVAGILGFIFTVVADAGLSIKTQVANSNYYGNFEVNVLLEVIAVHTFFKYHTFQNEKMNQLVVVLSKFGFGAYLIHTFIIESMAAILHFDTLSMNAWISVPLISIIVFGVSMGVSAVLNHIPVIKKYCV